MKGQKLTSWEWEGLLSDCNLADGHAHQKLTTGQMKVIKNLPSLYLQSEKKQQNQIQQDFEQVFFPLAGQYSYSNLLPPLYCNACSFSIEAVANFLRLENKSVTLIHPAFDNLPDILKRHQLKINALDEECLIDIDKNSHKITTDSLFLVCPNNPTGQELTKPQFESIVNFCKKRKVLLILDFSFRFYSGFTTWDQYEILQKSKIDFIVLEDTGKTWPTLEMKLGITVASASVYYELRNITNDFLLNVSPFIFKLLTEYIRLEDCNNISSRLVINENRNTLRESVKDTPLRITNPNTSLSVEWIQIPSHWKCSQFCEWLSKEDIHVLPGVPFYWNDNKKGESYIRIALARPTDFFKKASKKFQEKVLEYTEIMKSNA